jgi:hypothetical protein
MRSIQMKCLFAIAAVSVVGTAFAANETVFPKKNKTLAVTRPPECTQWVPPLPDKQARAEFPSESNSLKGDAALLVRIGSDGSYQGVIDFIASDDAFVRAAEKSMKEWTFTPAKCNGNVAASDARIDFEFRKEGSITYKTGTTSFSK